MGTQPSTLIQIYKQCVRPIFEYGALSTITTSDNIISKIQRLQNKFIRLALRLPKYICSKLLHDSTGLPYVKDRLLSCATKSQDRTAQNPLVEESISRNRLNPAWDRFPTPLSVVRSGQSPGGELPYEEYMGVCHELGSHFQEKIPKRYVNFSQKFRKGL